jgi:hypothetical protein
MHYNSFIFKYSSEIIFNFNFNFKNHTAKDQSKRRHLGWHPRDQFKQNPEPSGSFGRVH